MDPNTQVLFEFLPFVRIYKSGRYERPVVIHDRVPPSLDPATGVASKDAVIDPETSVWARLYLPTLSGQDPKKKLPLLVYFHGGGFCIGSAGSPFYHTYINSLTAKAKAIVVSVEYRLAPEHPLPAAYDDSWVGLRWVASHAEGSGPAEWLNCNADFDRVFLAGESAGANIAHNVAIRAGEAGLGHGVRVEGLALVHPYFWGAQRLESEHGDVRGRYLNPGILDAQWPAICPGAKDNDDPRVNPLAEGAPSLARLKCARALVCVAEKDVLRERGKAYYEALKGSGWGGVAEFMETEGEDHGFHFFDRILIPFLENRLYSRWILDAQWPAICPGAKDNDDPRVNPLAEGAPSLARLKCARALVCVAEKDVLRERGKAYYEALKGSGWGGVAEFMETEGEDHGFHFFKPDIEKAKAMMDCLVAFITGD